MKLRLLPPMLLVAVLLAGCGGGSGTGKLAAGDVAVVSNQHVTIAAYDQALAEERATLKQQGTAFPKAGSTQYEQLQTEIVDTLVEFAEFSIEAQKMHLSISPTAVQSQITGIKKKYYDGSEQKYLVALKAQGFTDAEVRQSIGERLLELKLFDTVTKNDKATAAQIASYYAANLTQYEKAASRKVREILAGKNKKALAEQIYAELKAGKSFAKLAKEYSQDPGSKNSGGLFTATKGADVPGFDAAVFSASAKTGELLEPVYTSQYGWFVIQPLAPIVPASTESEAKASASIRKTLDSNQQQQAFETWVDGIAKGFCGGGQISYQTGYSPSPDPCASLTTPDQTTT